MKQLLIFLLLLAGSVRTVAQVDTVAVKRMSLDEISQMYDSVNFVPPDYLRHSESKQSPIAILSKMMNIKSKKELNLVQNISHNVPMSKFQLIVDKSGNIIDCELLASTDMSKDNTVLNFLKNFHFFISPALLNGDPCVSVVIFNIAYQIYGFTYHLDSYPICL